MNKSSGIGVTIAALVIGLVVGFGGSQLISNNDDSHNDDASHSSMDMSAANETATASELRSTLVGLGVEHMTLTSQAVNASLAAAPGAEDQVKSLISNGTEISAAVGSVYGEEAQKAFQDIWNVHLNAFVAYAVASKGGDEAAKAAALKDIEDNYTMPIAALLSGANPNLPKATLEAGFRDHIDMTAKMIDAHVVGNYTEELKQRDMAVDHIQGLMSTLSGAIVKQFPEKFKA